MADYTKATNFTAKDGLSTGNPAKIVKGTEIDTELNAISNAIASKADINSPTFTGTPIAPTASAGTNTTQVATTAFVVAERTNTSTLTNKTLTSPVINTPTINTPTISTPAITGGTITGITDLTVADGGTGVSTLAANAVLLGNGTSALQTVAPSTSGNVLTSDGTTWTSQAIPSGGVTSLNGQTGAITNTSLDTIGSVISAVFAATVPYNGGNGYNANCGDTVAGSSLRRNYTVGSPGAFVDTTTVGGVGSPVSYDKGGTALTGTWRCMGRSVGYSSALNEGSENVATWRAGLFVRVS